MVEETKNIIIDHFILKDFCDDVKNKILKMKLTEDFDVTINSFNYKKLDDISDHYFSSCDNFIKNGMKLKQPYCINFIFEILCNSCYNKKFMDTLKIKLCNFINFELLENLEMTGITKFNDKILLSFSFD